MNWILPDSINNVSFVVEAESLQSFTLEKVTLIPVISMLLLLA